MDLGQIGHVQDLQYSGPRTEPCGTPNLFGIQTELFKPMVTLIVCRTRNAFSEVTLTTGSQLNQYIYKIWSSGYHAPPYQMLRSYPRVRAALQRCDISNIDGVTYIGD